MSIINSLEWRYATKKFNPSKKLSNQQINTLKNAFNLTATSYGMQPISLLIIKDKTLQQELVKHSKNQEQVSQASHLLVFCISNINRSTITDYFDRVKLIRDTPDEILNPFKEYLIDNFSQKNPEEIKDYCIKQAYLALGNLLTVCAIEGIDACPMEGFEPSAYDEFLSLKEKGLESVLLMPIGYRASDDMFAGFKKVRKNTVESIIEID
mgnify:CR=1 FL=1